jgi:RNA polymerase sigma-70 factor, ECF subfamily
MITRRAIGEPISVEETPSLEPSQAGSDFRETFDDFYRNNLGAVTGLALVLSGSRSAAEELAQEAFLAALTRWERISRYQDPPSWVRRVVANAATSRYRRVRAEARALLRLDRREYIVDEGDPDADRLWKAVQQLPARQAQVLALHYLDDRPVADIARILGLAEPTVKTHLQRGRSTLADRLGLEWT